MKFLIAGFGSIGRRHFRNLLALGERDIVVYRTGNSTLPVEELNGFSVETELEAALAHRPDGVVIANPTALHLPTAIPAAQGGASILMEKPVSSSLDGLNALGAALEQGGGKLLMGYQFRFHPGLQKIADLLSEGAIGRPLSARAHWGEYLPNWHPWEDYRKSYSARSDLGGGVVLTLCHPLDYLRWLLGEVEGVWSIIGKISDLEIQVEDVAEIGLTFASGAIASVHLNYYQRPATHTLEIAGTEGTIRWDNADGAVRLYRASKEMWEHFPAPASFERNDLFLAELRNFIACIKGEALPVCNLQDGVRSLQMALTAHESSRQGRVLKI